MRKLIQSQVHVENQKITKIYEDLVNTGNLELEKTKSCALTKDIIEVLKKYNMIDIEDDIVDILITVRA